MGTPAANQFEAVLSKKFPGIRFGRVNCRKISGSSWWSQHSWNNARDVYPPTGIENEWLDQVWAFIKANETELNVRVKLYRVKSHYNHIHIDFWPRGWGTPPCAGGSPRYKYPDGTVKSTATLINTYEGDYAPIILTEEDVLKKGDKGKRVGVAQEQLLDLGYELPRWGADEDFGSETEAAVKAFQADRALPTDGVLYATDLAILHDRGSDQGVKGDTGDQGVKGDTGDQGIKGDTGDQGEGVRANARLDKLKEAI